MACQTANNGKAQTAPTPMPEYCTLLQMLRPKGVKGAIVAAFVPPFSALNTQHHANKTGSDVMAGLPVYVVPPLLKGPRKTCIKSAAPHARGLVLVLDGVSDATLAHSLCGRYLLAAKNKLPAFALEAAQAEEDSFVGMTVSDVRSGLVGLIVETRKGVAQTLWVVDGSYGQVLIPAVEELIVDMGEDNIIVQLPDGLLELNQKQKQAADPQRLD